MSTTKMLNRTLNGLQAAGYAVATTATVALTLVPTVVALTANAANYVVPARGVQRRWEKFAEKGIDGVDFFASKTRHKAREAIGHEPHKKFGPHQKFGSKFL